MSGRQLAGQLGVSPSWVSYRLTGAQPIDVNDMQRMADALGVAVIELLPASARVGQSQGAGRGSARSDLNDSSCPPAPSADRSRVTAPRPNVRTHRHVAAAGKPYGGGRRDATRPVSAVPFNKRRPTLTRPGVRPIDR